MSLYEKKIEDVIDSVQEFYGVNRDQLFGKSRLMDIVKARHVLAYCLREKFKLSFPIIGAMFNRDHTTIMHACENALALIHKNSDLADFIKNVLGEEEQSEKIITPNFQRYINETNQLELEEYKKVQDELREKRDFLIKKAQEDYLSESLKLKKNRENIKKTQEEELNETKNSVSGQYLSPKKDLLNQFDLTNELRSFLPKYKEGVTEFGFPIRFDEDYIDRTFRNLDPRARNILIRRYGFLNKETATLDELAVTEKVSRERIRQLVQSGVNKIYFNNFGGLRQIINLIAEKIIKEDIVAIKWCLNEYFIFDKEKEAILLKFLLVIILSIKWIKEFDFVGNKFFINIHDEKRVFDQIDHIKLLIEKISSAMPDLVENKWEYIWNNLKLYEFFSDKKHLLNEDFLRACYDNFLFESEIIVYKTDSLKKYRSSASKEISKTSGIPEEYKVFFE